MGWILIVDAVVALWAGLALLTSSTPTPAEWRSAGLLAACLVYHAARTARGEEKRRAYRLATEHVDHTGVWNVSAALVLPPALALAVTVAIRCHRWPRARKQPGRFLFSTAAIMASVLVCHAVAQAHRGLDWLHGLAPTPTGFLPSIAAILGIAAAASGYFLTQLFVIAVARALRPPNPGRSTADQKSSLVVRLIGTTADNREEIVTILVGTVAAAVVASLLWGLPVLAIAIAARAWTRYVQQNEVREHERQRDADTDGKTGLLNHDGWRKHGAVAAVLGSATAQPSAVLMIDGDGLKAINDQHGHLVGDVVIAKLAGAIKAAVRASAPGADIVARWGGDEFAVFLADCTATDALAVAERIRQDVEQLKIRALAGAGAKPITLRKTVSIGVATSQTTLQDLSDPLGRLEKEADSALYAAKTAGRNRVEMTTLDPPGDTINPSPCHLDSEAHPL